MTLAIDATDLEKDYGDVRALDGLNLSVEQGEFFGLLGPNGAGKTTFINTLVGLVRKTGGEVTVFGNDVEDEYREVRDSIGLAPQEFNVDRFFPIREVLMHKAGYHGVSEAERERRADEALKLVGIYDKRNTRFDWLSGGMKRRLLLARAIVTEPNLLILDEPTAGVDVQLRHDLWEVINRLNDEGTTILLTTHYIEEAERLCDRVAIMDSGRKVTVATPEELTERGSDTITVELRDPPASAPPLDGLSEVEDTRLEDDRLAVRVAGSGGRVAPRLLNALEDRGHEITDIDISRTSLEEIFVELTEGQRGSDEPDGDGTGEDGTADEPARLAGEAR
ncbi:trehalose/maltose import ATP-binding protein MalK [Halalkalicoccus paucihalophilus]|uniref:Trehalose/maltose import ATP-binding protein MalK n=1 Tax=Halalkalicoccus paucihalophilus TaxID=1008153 RepID=A0A151AG50_9EURY|nr:ABC transporter ATP-binding protein [Halalkalicoccus paucihalophilus]KYH26570.1 trehalose/maltose import ATP-binding protein MalK [Halalkalicoccus paucihalophilus]